MRSIALTRSKCALVDDEDYEELSRYKWHALHTLHTWYAGRYSHNSEGVPSSFIYMHRQILGLIYGDGRETDHQDGDGLNNQRSNLRTCTRAENNRNIPAKTHQWRTSKYKGVCWDRQRERWRANIFVAGHQRQLGRFAEEHAAAMAYDLAARQFFGAYARTNFMVSHGV